MNEVMERRAKSYRLRKGYASGGRFTRIGTWIAGYHLGKTLSEFKAAALAIAIVRSAQEESDSSHRLDSP